MLNTLATGGSLVTTTAGNFDTNAMTWGISGNVSLNGLLQIDSVAQGGTAKLQGTVATDANISSYANAVSMQAQGGTQTLAAHSSVQATATGGRVIAELTASQGNQPKISLRANVNSQGISTEGDTSFNATDGLTILSTATGGTVLATGATKEQITVDSNVYAEGFNISTTKPATLGNNTNITATATGGTTEINALNGTSQINTVAAADGIIAYGSSATLSSAGTNITTSATGGKVTIGQADTSDIESKIKAEAQAYGVLSSYDAKGNIILNGDTTIITKATAGTIDIIKGSTTVPAQKYNDYTQAYALYNNSAAGKEATITVNADKSGSVKIQGDIVAATGKIAVNLNGNTSALLGTVLQTNQTDYNKLGTANGGDIILNLDNGAKWSLANNSQLRGATPIYANTLAPDSDGRGMINVHTLNVGQGTTLDFTADNLTRGYDIKAVANPNNPLWRVIQSKSGTNGTGGGFNFTGTGNTVLLAANLAGSNGTQGVFSDKIIVDSIANTQTGANYLAINDATASNTVQGKLLVVQYAKANADTWAQSFTGKAMNIGAIKATPRLNLDKSFADTTKNGWYLTGYTVQPSDTVVGASSMTNSSFALLRTMDNNLQKRMGELRHDSGEQGAWMRIYGGETSVTGNTRVQMRNIQGGYDIVRKANGGKNVTGIMVEHSTADNSFDVGIGETNNTRVGLYHAWLGESGSYYDIVAKTGRMRNKITVYGDDLTPGNVYSDYNSWNSTFGFEYGKKINIKNGFYYTPQVELVYGRINGADYMSSNNISLKSSSINSLLGRIGITLGKDLNNKSNVYLSANLYHEFLAKTAIDASTPMNNSRLETDLKGTSFELVLGGNLKVSKNSNMYGEISKSFAGKVKNDWQIQLGARFGF